MDFADSIIGYGNHRFIEVFFRSFKNNSHGYSTSKEAPTVSCFNDKKGRLSVMQPSKQKQTVVAPSKSVVTIFLEELDDNDIREYDTDELSTAYWDRQDQKLITSDELMVLIDTNDEVDDSLVHYAGA